MANAEWEPYKTAQRERRAVRLPKRTDAIFALKRQGYIVEQKTAYHFRVNDRLDLYPIHNRWHDLKTNEHGDAADLATFIKERIRPNEIGRK